MGVTIAEAVHAAPLPFRALGSLLQAEAGSMDPTPRRIQVVEPHRRASNARSARWPDPPVVRTLTVTEAPEDASKRRIRYVVSVIS